MRKADRVYSQTFFFRLNPLPRGRFWKIKLPLHCCSSMASVSHALPMHRRSRGMAGSLCQESSPRSQPAALWPHGQFCLRFISCILVQTWRGLQLVPCSCKPRHTPAAPEISLNKLNNFFLSKGRLDFVLDSRSLPFQITDHHVLSQDSI